MERGAETEVRWEENSRYGGKERERKRERCKSHGNSNQKTSLK